LYLHKACDKQEIRGIEPGGVHYRTTEYHKPEPEWGEKPHHPRRKLLKGIHFQVQVQGAGIGASESARVIQHRRFQGLSICNEALYSKPTTVAGPGVCIL